jgi:hypothetical protein
MGYFGFEQGTSKTNRFPTFSANADFSFVILCRRQFLAILPILYLHSLQSAFFGGSQNGCSPESSSDLRSSSMGEPDYASVLIAATGRASFICR